MGLKKHGIKFLGNLKGGQTQGDDVCDPSGICPALQGSKGDASKGSTLISQPTPKLTGMQSKSTEGTSPNLNPSETFEALTLFDSPHSTSLPSDFHARIYRLLENEKGWAGNEAVSFSRLCVSSGLPSPKFLSSKMLRDFSHQTGDGIFKRADIGLYECEWQLLNTRWFLPQNRERIFFIGHLGGESRPKVFPVRETDFIYSEEHGENISRGCVNTLDSNYHKGWLDHGQRTMILHNSYPGEARISEDCCPTLSTPAGGGHLPYVVCDSGLHRVSQVRTDALPPLRAGRGADRSHSYIVNGIRRLTPTECERLQGFPDGWTEGVSDTQRYKTLGNAVSVPCAEMIFRRLYF